MNKKIDSTTVSADNVPFSQDCQDEDREVPGFDDLALDDDNEENGSDNSDSDDENLADQSFPGNRLITDKHKNILL